MTPLNSSSPLGQAAPIRHTKSSEAFTNAYQPILAHKPTSQLQLTIRDTINNFNSDYKSLISELWKDHEIPLEIQEKIAQFEKRWEPQITKLRNGYTWIEMKSDKTLKPSDINSPFKPYSPGEIDKENDHSWEGFRQQAIQMIQECVNIRLQKMGVHPVESWGGVGTPGVNSDVDLSLSEASKDSQKILPLTEEDLMFAKMFFETLWTKVFQGLSGVQADTEVYVRHNGTLENADFLKTEMGKNDFNYIENLGSALTAYRNFALDNKLPLWKIYKEDLGKTLSLNTLEANHFFNQVESLINQQIIDTNHHALKLFYEKKGLDTSKLNKLDLQESINLLSKTKKQYPEFRHELELNSFFFVYPNIMKLSTELTHLFKQILNIEEKLKTGKYDGSKNENLQSLEIDLDLLRNRFVLLSLVRVTTFPEGYYTEGAFKRVVVKAGGQIHDRKSEELEKLFEKTGIKDLNALNDFESPIIQDHLESGMENYALWLNKIYKHDEHQNLKTSDNQLIDASKYGQRFLYDDLEMLKISRTHNLNKIQWHLDAIAKILKIHKPEHPFAYLLDDLKGLLTETLDGKDIPQKEITASWNKFLKKAKTLKKKILNNSKYEPQQSEIKNQFSKLHNIAENFIEDDIRILHAMSEVVEAKSQMEDLLVAKRNVRALLKNLPELIRPELHKEQEANQLIHQSLDANILEVDQLSKPMTANELDEFYADQSSRFSTNLVEILTNKKYISPHTFKEAIKGVVIEHNNEKIGALSDDQYLKKFVEILVSVKKQDFHKIFHSLQKNGFFIPDENSLKKLIKDLSNLSSIGQSKPILELFNKNNIKIEKDSIKEIINKEIILFQNEVKHMSLLDILVFVLKHPSMLSKNFLNLEYFRYQIFKHKVKEYLNKEFPLRNVESTIKEIQATVKKVDSDTKGAAPSQFYQYLIIQLYKKHVWAVNPTFLDPLKPELKATFESLFALPSHFREIPIEIKQKIKKQSKEITLSKIEDKEGFVHNLRRIHNNLIMFIYGFGRTKIRTAKSAVLPINLVDIWNNPIAE